jgi:hypothetical protein
MTSAFAWVTPEDEAVPDPKRVNAVKDVRLTELAGAASGLLRGTPYTRSTALIAPSPKAHEAESETLAEPEPVEEID